MASLAPWPVAIDMRFVTPDIKHGDYYIMRAPITGGVKYVYPRMMGEKKYAVWWPDKWEGMPPSRQMAIAMSAIKKEQGKLKRLDREPKEKSLFSLISDQHKHLNSALKELKSALEDKKAPSASRRISTDVQRDSDSSILALRNPEKESDATKLIVGAAVVLGVAYFFSRKGI